MRHQQYRESLLERLRQWRVANIDGSLGDAKRALRPVLTEGDIDLLFDNWLNANFDRIEVSQTTPGSVTAVVVQRHYRRDPALEAEQRRKQDFIAGRVATGIKSNLFESFAARIWETALPSGVVLRDATGKDMKHASGWFGEIGKRMKSTEKVAKKFSTRQLFDLSQREVFKGVA